MTKNDEPNRSEGIEIELRVRYPECDPAGVAHHSVFPVYLELARCEHLRKRGIPYAKLEAEGIIFVVARMSFRFRRPIFYDNLITVHAWVTEAARAKVDYAYEIKRDGALMTTAETTLVCVDREGRPQAIPDAMR